jgi:hypothetical protein
MSGWKPNADVDSYTISVDFGSTLILFKKLKNYYQRRLKVDANSIKKKIKKKNTISVQTKWTLIVKFFFKKNNHWHPLQWTLMVLKKLKK